MPTPFFNHTFPKLFLQESIHSSNSSTNLMPSNLKLFKLSSQIFGQHTSGTYLKKIMQNLSINLILTSYSLYEGLIEIERAFQTSKDSAQHQLNLFYF